MADATPEEIEYLKKLRRYKQLKTEWAMFFYQPYRKQVEFHNIGKTKRERALFANNQGGKCVTYQTLIETPSGSKRAGDIRVGDVVWGWNGRRVPVTVSALVRKPPEPIYRLLLSTGDLLECASGHLLLLYALPPMLRESYARVQDLLSYGAIRPRSTSEHAQIAHGVDVPRLSRKEQGSAGSYSTGHRQRDELSLVAEDSDRQSPPLQADARQLDALSWHEDDLGTTHNDSPSYRQFRPATLGVPHRPSAQFSGSVKKTHDRPGKSYQRSNQESAQPSFASPFVSQSGLSVARHQLESFSLLQSPNGGYAYIIGYEILPPQELYDFQIEVTHNYLAAGLINHNTYCAAQEVAFHMTGVYPAWWEGKRFPGPQIWWIGSETGELTRDGAQMKILGQHGQFGSGAIPKPLLAGDPLMARGIPAAAEIFNVKHASGGVSQGVFKAYSDGREKWQAGTVHGVWLDEEPAADIYSEALTRTNATEGIVMLTLTPLKGMSEVVRRFYPKPDTDDRAIVSMTIDDSDHFSAEQKQKIINSYQPYEREARLRGIPMLGTGKIFPVPEDWIVVPCRPIPEHWRKIGGLDFGWDHPTAAVELAYDKEADCVYVTKEYRARRETPVIHAAAVKPWGLIWAWPHDALQHDKGSGEQLANLYRKHGLKMLSERAQFPDERGNGVEAGIAEMLERMQTGRWKVMDNCQMWLEEFRSYHRKDGKIVKEYEDLISASRYAYMCLRHASAKRDAPKKRDPYDSRTTSRERSWLSA